MMMDIASLWEAHRVPAWSALEVTPPSRNSCSRDASSHCRNMAIEIVERSHSRGIRMLPLMAGRPCFDGNPRLYLHARQSWLFLAALLQKG